MRMTRSWKASGPQGAFSLLELVLVLALGSLLVLGASRLLVSSLETNQSLRQEIMDREDANYALAYFKEEFFQAEKIIEDKEGRIYLYTRDPDHSFPHRYIYYWLDGDRSLYRGAFHSKTELDILKPSFFKAGKAQLLGGVQGFDLDLEAGLVTLKIDLGEEEVGTTLALRGRGL
ncbi:MAG: hypothetical protein Q4E37_01310 [Tissierellia bacterium]|nr:hypothetical protein [Tissierellia bacterium]